MKLVWFALVLQGCVLHVSGLAIQHASSSNSSRSFLEGRPGAILFEAYERLTGRQIPTVNHDKVPGNGYLPGSPLYDKQEALKSGDGTTAPEADQSVPGSECQSNLWMGWCMLLKYPKSTLVNLLVQIVLFVLFAYLYKTYKPKFYTPNKSIAPVSENWAYGLFSCHDCRPDLPICCMAFCCMGIRWADTLSSWKLMPGNYWSAIAAYLILQILAPFTGGITYLIMLVAFIYIRQRIRGVFNHSPWTCFTLCTDCLTWWCCSCCATVQEAREVEKVMITSASSVPPQYTFAQGGNRDGLPPSIATMPPTGLQVPTASNGPYPTLPQSGMQPFGSSMSSQGAATK